MGMPFESNNKQNEIVNTKKKEETKRVVTKSKFNFKTVDSSNKKVASAITKSFTQNRLTPAQLQAFRRAKAQRMQVVAMQSNASIQSSGWDNKFERELAEDKFKLDELERLRRFHETPPDYLIRKAALTDLKHQREWEMKKRHNMFKQHEMQPKMNLNLLGVDSVCNLLKSQPIWNPNSSDSNIFRDTGRPNILDTPNTFAVTPQTQAQNILKAPVLSWGKVDTTRKPRRFIKRRPEDNF